NRVLEAMPLYSATVLVRAGKAQRRTNSYAASYNFPTLLNWRMESGRFFTAAEEREYATVALLGKKLAKLLFPHAVDPRGQTVIVDDVPFQVLGVLESKGALVGNSDEDDVVVMPYTTGSTRVFGTPFLSWISVSMADAEHSQQTVDAITANLTRVHRIKDFSVYNRAAFVAAAKSTREIMTSLLTATAIIALVVGGIGVMNVMLMTVSERTSEIGIRMAVGAKRRDVLAQFLTEAVVLSSIGGVVGLILGLAVGLAARGMGQKVIFTAEASVLAFVCAALTGLLCGYLPARRAASLDPVAALARR
ncbi:MAG: MacB family efflux pump subunit, partial [Pseudomonadota bacterium]